jgi:hypothetical protein
LPLSSLIFLIRIDTLARDLKRQFQLFAMVLTALLAGGPSLAAAACTFSSTMFGASCPMGMAKMDADCPMAQSLAADCSQECCNRAQSPAVVIPGVPGKPKLLAIALHFVQLAAISIPTAGSTAQPVPLRVAASPPLHLLNCVFRI